MRALVLLLALFYAPGAAAQGRLLDPGRYAVGFAPSYVLPSGQPGSGLSAVAQVGRLGLMAGVAEAPPPGGFICADVCPQNERLPSVVLAASWALAEQREGRPARVELVAEAALDRYETTWEGASSGFAHRRGALGVVLSSRSDVHRPLLLVPSASARVEVAETFRETEGRVWVGGGLGWGLALGAHALLWVEAHSEADVWRGRYRTTFGGGLVGTF